MLDRKWFSEVGKEIRKAYRTHVFTKALDVNDKPFSSNYNPKYKMLKQAGKLPRQFERGGKINAPKVSWDLLRDFGKIWKVTDTGFEMGWAAYGERIQWLKDMEPSRELTTKEDALPKSIVKNLSQLADKQIKKKLGGNNTTRHKIGK